MTTPSITLAGLSDLNDVARLLAAQYREHEIPAPANQIERAAL